MQTPERHGALMAGSPNPKLGALTPG
ncbi:hypothetical protein EYZ11_013502 [Aspergillus tanneri]|uniref:Uncharacterized protein n=1 Tax=Aspergillus tanneri TaxID=1220188 RepID=A0A4S3IXL7_9EURO|nr:hypothetical protein EYZ11_013502 [Aspergillus tanneri]